MESNEYKQIRGKPYNNLAKKTKCMIRCYAGKSQQTVRDAVLMIFLKGYIKQAERQKNKNNCKKSQDNKN